MTDEQVSTTLAWTSRNAEKMLSPEHNDQQPIVPTRKKEFANVKPSSKERTSTAIPKVTQIENDQDVDMEITDIGQKSHSSPGIVEHATSLDDPIESYGSNKQRNNSMEVDSEGTGFQQADEKHDLILKLRNH